MDKFKSKFQICLALYIPIAILIWLVPYVKPLSAFMTSIRLFNGVTLYIILNFLIATFIQFYMGIDFYKSAYKSLKHKSANMDVLIVIGTSAAWLYGLILILIGYSDTIQEDTMKYKM